VRGALAYYVQGSQLVIYSAAGESITGTSCASNDVARALRRSTDGGGMFTNSATNLHADAHAIKYAPNNTNIVFHANDGGVYKSTNNGVN
jgi:hypothetical protein